MNEMSINDFDARLSRRAPALVAIVAALRAMTTGRLPGVTEEPYQVAHGWGTRFKLGNRLLLAADPKPDSRHVCVKVPGARPAELKAGGFVHSRKNADPWVDVTTVDGVRALILVIDAKFEALTGQRPPKAPTWTASEIERVVADYFDRMERVARGAIDTPSIERQEALLPGLEGHTAEELSELRAGISASLEQQGQPFIGQFEPAETVQPPVNTFVNAYLDLPEQPNDALGLPPQIRRNIDYAAIAERNRELGAKGEEWVVAYERSRLHEAGRPDLAERVEWVAQTMGDGFGYDIRSFSGDGSDRLIEVKTTSLAGLVAFWVTDKEVKVSQQKADLYFLYRVSNFGTDPQLDIYAGAVSAGCQLTPTVYRATPHTRPQENRE